MGNYSDNDVDSVVIIGAGHAGGTVAALLRQRKFTGDIALIGSEGVAPYQRPPLSKAWLSGDANFDKISLRPEKWYQDQDIELALNSTVTRIDLKKKSIELNNDFERPYETLIIATGARARKLGIPGESLTGVCSLRDIGDAEAIKQYCAPNRKIVLIGAGYIGLEVAASIRKSGGLPHVLELQQQCIARVASESLARFIESYHRGKGVEISFNVNVESIDGDDRVEGVNLSNGQTIKCDGVIIGVGAIPNVEIATEAGIECDGGVIVDRDGRTSNSSVFAIGDVSRRPSTYSSSYIRLESVPNALEQARRVASIITNGADAPEEVPWFWSDQYDLKIQIAGLLQECNETVLRGQLETSRFALFHLRDNIVRAVEAVNSPAEFMAGKKLIEQGMLIDAKRLSNPDVPMKEFL